MPLYCVTASMFTVGNVLADSLTQKSRATNQSSASIKIAVPSLIKMGNFTQSYPNKRKINIKK